MRVIRWLLAILGFYIGFATTGGATLAAQPETAFPRFEAGQNSFTVYYGPGGYLERDQFRWVIEQNPIIGWLVDTVNHTPGLRLGIVGSCDATEWVPAQKLAQTPSGRKKLSESLDGGILVSRASGNIELAIAAGLLDTLDIVWFTVRGKEQGWQYRYASMFLITDSEYVALSGDVEALADRLEQFRKENEAEHARLDHRIDILDQRVGNLEVDFYDRDDRGGFGDWVRNNCGLAVGLMTNGEHAIIPFVGGRLRCSDRVTLAAALGATPWSKSVRIEPTVKLEGIKPGEYDIYAMATQFHVELAIGQASDQWTLGGLLGVSQVQSSFSDLSPDYRLRRQIDFGVWSAFKLREHATLQVAYVFGPGYTRPFPGIYNDWEWDHRLIAQLQLGGGR